MNSSSLNSTSIVFTLLAYPPDTAAHAVGAAAAFAPLPLLFCSTVRSVSTRLIARAQAVHVAHNLLLQPNIRR